MGVCRSGLQLIVLSPRTSKSLGLWWLPCCKNCKNFCLHIRYLCLFPWILLQVPIHEWRKQVAALQTLKKRAP
ncbi:hypothetical protein CK203_068719 [Vitis vinifera]|uniref:Uncharacterized protein n=1 Tax=Vitis vinifera TaxID=29760 RepID=A0A438EDT4_VITVI|nr:hypothetical protein CK203_068719 [Vitis vinifera]